ncbi:MAG: hypothetical protein RBT34_02920 [Anaerolineaceae bacterium]|jgi:hypothetical protein|nr:hypothetical protein [Anaerolineaceae bacterium]
MPAIQLNRVREQINKLLWLFTQPAAFQRSLHELLGFYADPIFRAGQTTRNMILIPSYHSPKLLLQQLELALYPRVQENPTAALILADTLWQDKYLEPRQVAASILGQLPIEHAEAVTQRITEWSSASQPAPLMDALLTRGTDRLRLQSPHILYALAADWLSDPDVKIQLLGLKLIHPLVQSPEFENLPEIFTLLRLPLQNLSPRNLTETRHIIQALARKSPSETAYFLRQSLSMDASKDLIRLIRKSLPAFPTETQERLRQAIKERENH